VYWLIRPLSLCPQSSIVEQKQFIKTLFSEDFGFQSVKKDSTATSVPIRVYFLGSGELGIPVLEALRQDPDIDIVGIGTQVDRPGGRKRRPLATPVAQYADRAGVEVDKVASVNAAKFLTHLHGLASELLLVVAFGQLLKTELLGLPCYGCMNVHASILPRHRGASPVTAAILAGDKETGVTFMRIDEGLDTGPVYRVVRQELTGAETTEELEHQLAELAGGHVVECVHDVCHRKLAPVPQPVEGATYAKKLKKQDGEIDWTASADVIERQIRAFQPWPRSFFRVPSRKVPRRVQVIAATVEPGNTDCAAGTVIQADKQGWIIACGEGALRLARVIPEGRSQMDACAFLRGSPVASGTVLPGSH